MTQIHYRVEIFEEEGQYVGLAPELNVSSFGDTPEEASASLQEAVELFLEGCEELGTLEEVLEESGFEKRDDHTWIPRKRISENKVAVISELIK